MKGKGLQLTVEVGRTRLPPLPYREYALTISLNKDLTASTTFTLPNGSHVDFGTRLFLRTDAAALEETGKCLVLLTGEDERGSRCELGRGWGAVRGEGVQSIEIGVSVREGGSAWADLQFCVSLVEGKQSKSINNRANSFKSQISQKQSSCDPKQPHHPQTISNCASTPTLDQPTPNDTEYCDLKVSKSQKMLFGANEELQTSAATVRRQTNITQQQVKYDDSETMLSLQIKIDQLQQRLTDLNTKLESCSGELQKSSGDLERALGSLETERSRVRVLEAEKEQLMELLVVEELRGKIAMGHVVRFNHFIDQMGKEGDSIELIQEKDQIIMLNQELEMELGSKNIVISQLQAELALLKDKIAVLQAKNISKILVNPVIPAIIPLHQAPSHKKLPHIANKQLQRVKSQKRILDKNPPNPNKKHQDTTKQSNNPKQQSVKPKQPQRKRIKKQPQIVKPPPRQLKETKSPTNKADPNAHLKIPKARNSKDLKVQHRPALQSEKRSTIAQSSLGSLAMELDLVQANNLMLDSRSVEASRGLEAVTR